MCAHVGGMQAQLEAEVQIMRRELAAEYKRQLEALEAECTARANARTAELEAAHALKLQQVRHDRML